uniref:ATP-binding cassette domain-containing protein n=1 Tax=Achromobacter sp. GbtcB20 TaxID=2824765 RepID=UPI001C2FF896
MLDVSTNDQYYGGGHTLRGVSLAERQGECLALLGRKGVGKTTLLKSVMGVLPGARGGITFGGA